VPARVPIYVAALQERMVRQAVRVADGVITTGSPPTTSRRCAVVRDEARKVGKDPETYPIVCRISVCPSIQPGSEPRAREQFRRAVTAYLNVPVYRRFHQWLGRGDALAEMNARWDAATAGARSPRSRAGDRRPRGARHAGAVPRDAAALRRQWRDGAVLNFMNLETDPAARAEESRAFLKALAPS